jgi:hypothetical protein
LLPKPRERERELERERGKRERIRERERKRERVSLDREIYGVLFSKLTQFSSLFALTNATRGGSEQKTKTDRKHTSTLRGHDAMSDLNVILMKKEFL